MDDLTKFLTVVSPKKKIIDEKPKSINPHVMAGQPTPRTPRNKGLIRPF